MYHDIDVPIVYYGSSKKYKLLHLHRSGQCQLLWTSFMIREVIYDYPVRVPGIWLCSNARPAIAK